MQSAFVRLVAAEHARSDAASSKLATNPTTRENLAPNSASVKLIDPVAADGDRGRREFRLVGDCDVYDRLYLESRAVENLVPAILDATLEVGGRPVATVNVAAARMCRPNARRDAGEDGTGLVFLDELPPLLPLCLISETRGSAAAAAAVVVRVRPEFEDAVSDLRLGCEAGLYDNDRRRDVAGRCHFLAFEDCVVVETSGLDASVPVPTPPSGFVKSAVIGVLSPAPAGDGAGRGRELAEIGLDINGIVAMQPAKYHSHVVPHSTHREIRDGTYVVPIETWPGRIGKLDLKLVSRAVGGAGEEGGGAGEAVAREARVRVAFTFDNAIVYASGQVAPRFAA